MAIYHVGTGELSGTIYAGTLSKDLLQWKNRTDVTDEAIHAVRDHLMMKAKEAKQDWFGYEWDRKDGKKVVLKVMIV